MVRRFTMEHVKAVVGVSNDNSSLQMPCDFVKEGEQGLCRR